MGNVKKILNKHKEVIAKQFLFYLDLVGDISIGNRPNDTICIRSSGMPRFEKITFESHKLTKIQRKRLSTTQIMIFSPILKDDILGEPIARFSDGVPAISTDGVQLFFNFDPFFSFLCFSQEFGVTTGSWLSKIIMQMYSLSPNVIRDYVRNIFRKKEIIILKPEDYIGASNNTLVLLIEDFLISQGLAKFTQKQTQVVMSHDIDSKYCQEIGINSLLNILLEHKVRATWFFVPMSRQYRINSRIIKDLIDKEMEIGIHGYSHDGLLDKIPTNMIVKRLLKAKSKMLRLKVDTSVFRSPFMLRSHNITKSLKEASFTTDSSYPDKNTLSLTKTQKGVEYNRPFIHMIDQEGSILNSPLIEIPSCYPQDVQILGDFDLPNDIAFEYWKYKFDFIKDFRGVFVFHGHPIYLANREELYNKIIQYFKKQKTTFSSFDTIKDHFLKRIISNDSLGKLSVDFDKGKHSN